MKGMIEYTINVDGTDVDIGVKIHDLRGLLTRHPYPARTIYWSCRVNGHYINSFQSNTYVGLKDDIRARIAAHRKYIALQEALKQRLDEERKARVARHEAKQKRRAEAQRLKARLANLQAHR